MNDFNRIIMINFSTKIIFLFSFLCIFALSSCNKNSYPCPGSGQSTAASLSKFDEDGNLRESNKKAKAKNERGLVSKKQNGRLKNRRKESLGDKPKNMKK